VLRSLALSGTSPSGIAFVVCSFLLNWIEISYQLSIGFVAYLTRKKKEKGKTFPKTDIICMKQWESKLTSLTCGISPSQSTLYKFKIKITR